MGTVRATMIAVALISFPAIGHAQCAAGANCSTGQSGGNSIGTLNQFGPPRTKDGLYQHGERIGKVSAAHLSGKDDIVFDGFRLSAFPDPNSPVEFGDLKVRCPNLNFPPQAANSAQFAFVESGPVPCKVIGKISRKRFGRRVPA